MRIRFPLGLLLAGLAAGIVLVWIGDPSSPDPARTAGGGEISPLQSEDHGLPTGPGEPVAHPREPDTTERTSAVGPDLVAAQADGPSPGIVSATRPRKPATLDRGTPGLPDDREAEQFVIGGLVQNEEGAPIAYIEVLAERVDDSDAAPPEIDLAVENQRSSLTDAEGNFLFRNLEDGEYRVRIAPIEGIAPAQAMVRAGTLNVSLVVVGLWDFRIYGTVSSSADGTPIAGVHIIAGPTTRSTSTGPGGGYELDIGMRGMNVVHTIHFQHADFRHQRIRVNPAELDDLTVDYQLDVSMEPLKGLATVTGELTDTKGSPVGGKTLTLLKTEQRTMYRSTSDSSGNFLFEDVEPGEDYQLQIRPGSGYQNKDINPLVVPDGTLNLDIVLELTERGELSGWMTDMNGNPIPGFSLPLHSTIATGESVNVVGDGQGFFYVDSFPVGGAMFRSNSHPVFSVTGIRVTYEPEEPVTVVLDTGRHVLQGRVINLFGDPVAASSITLDWEFRDKRLRSASARKTTSDYNGYFAFTGLGPGEHTMQVSAAGFRIAAFAIDVSTDPTDVVVELEEEDSGTK